MLPAVLGGRNNHNCIERPILATNRNCYRASLAHAVGFREAMEPGLCPLACLLVTQHSASISMTQLGWLYEIMLLLALRVRAPPGQYEA